ncbi:MAG: DUF4912 domain-containing protein [Clostridia bacterium]|jgi:hypothetical protein|nr:DUF4912 domain-containing protein [Clostridia bacterium]
MPRAVKKETEEKLKETKSKATANSKKSSATKKTDKTKSISSASKKSAGVKIAKKSTKKDATVAKEKIAKKPVKKATKAKAKTTAKATVKKKVVKIPSLATKRKSTSKKVKEEEKDFVNILEYYDLPYRYNETVVKILAQTPKILFVYWDVSDNDREKYKEKYGEYFFNDTYPVLIVRNKTFNYYQEVEINDFANSWYISINDSRSEYSVELGRRFKEYAKRNEIMPHKEDVNSLIHVTESNNLVMPNDRVLLNELQPQVKYRNVKTGEESFKNVRSILANNKLVDFYELYKELYQVEDLSEFLVLGDPTLANPTSSFMNPTSTFK